MSDQFPGMADTRTALERIRALERNPSLVRHPVEKPHPPEPRAEPDRKVPGVFRSGEMGGGIGQDGGRGTDGTNGVDGTDGTDGVDGVDGVDATMPAFASPSASATTVGPDDPATATITGAIDALFATFEIPRGQPGEVTTAAMNAAIAIAIANALIGYVNEAPSDGNLYARKNFGWESLGSDTTTGAQVDAKIAAALTSFAAANGLIYP
jgi:hypothetical protein